MKVSLASSMALSIFLAAFGGQAAAMGRPAQVFETSTEAGIWDHGQEFYLRLDLSELAELKDQKFLWAGFHADASGKFVGEVVADNFGKNERRFPAQATVLKSTALARYFLIEILGPQGEVIKELFLKGPASVLPER